MMESLKPFDRGKARTREQAMDDVRRYNPNQIPATDTPQPKPEFYVVERPEAYDLRNVPYNGGLYKVFLWKKLRNHDETHTQDDWLRIPTMHKIMSAKLLYTLLRESCNSTDSKTIPKMMEEIFMPDIMMNCPYLSTRIGYNRSGYDHVISDLSSNLQTVAIANIPRHICSIDAAGMEDTISAILGTRDVEEVERVFIRCTGRQPLIIGRTQNLDNTNTSAVNIRILNDKTVIDCGASIYDKRPARAMTMELETL